MLVSSNDIWTNRTRTAGLAYARSPSLIVLPATRRRPLPLGFVATRVPIWADSIFRHERLPADSLSGRPDPDALHPAPAFTVAAAGQRNEWHPKGPPLLRLRRMRERVIAVRDHGRPIPRKLLHPHRLRKPRHPTRPRRLFEGMAEPDQQAFAVRRADEGEADRQAAHEAGRNGEVRIAGNGGG